jgi:hypothetical protein
LWRKLASSAPAQIVEPVPTEANQVTSQTEIARPLPNVQAEQSLTAPVVPSIESIPGKEPAPEEKTRVSDFHTHPGTVVPRHGVPSNYIPPKAKSEGSFRKKLATWWLAGKSFKKNVNTGAQKVTSRVAPGLKIKTPTLSTSTMLFIAIAIPLVIVTIGATVYIQRGRSVRHQYYLEQAQELVAYAQSEPDKAMRLIYWQQALGFILQAEDNGSTTDSQNLLNTIQTNLDAMLGISRATLEPALFESLPSTVDITKIVSAYDGVYAMDSSGGRILHFTRKDQYTFQVDYNFTCGPVGGNLSIGPLIDVIVLPINDITLEPDKPSALLRLGEKPCFQISSCTLPWLGQDPGNCYQRGKFDPLCYGCEDRQDLDLREQRLTVHRGSDLLLRYQAA